MLKIGKKYGEAFSPLQELITQGFDEEQIWEQMLLEYEPKLSFFEKLFAQAQHITAPCKENDQSDLAVKDNVGHASSDKAEELGQGYVSETENDQELLSESENDQDLEEQEDNGVDDEFFSLKEMEKFADVMETKSVGSDMDFIDSGKSYL